MPRGQEKRKGLTHATLSLHLSFSLSFSSVHYLLQSKQVLVLLLHKQTYHGETFNIHVHFSANGNGLLYNDSLYKSEILAPFRYRQTNAKPKFITATDCSNNARHLSSNAVSDNETL